MGEWAEITAGLVSRGIGDVLPAGQVFRHNGQVVRSICCVCKRWPYVARHFCQYCFWQETECNTSLKEYRANYDTALRSNHGLVQMQFEREGVDRFSLLQHLQD